VPLLLAVPLDEPEAPAVAVDPPSPVELVDSVEPVVPVELVVPVSSGTQ